MAKRNSLTPRQTQALAHYLSGKSGSESARLAGYSPRNARRVSSELFGKNPLALAAIAEHRDRLRTEANFSAEKAMLELNEQIAKATDAKQYSAVARLVELKMKMCGLLTEKKDAPQSSLTLNIVGVDMAAPTTPAPTTIQAAIPANIFD